MGLTGSIARGLGAGAIGTLAMTGWQELSSRLMSPDEDSGEHTAGDDTGQDGGDNTQDASQNGGQGGGAHDPWEQAPVPAQVARKLANLAGIDPGPERIPLLTNIMHWGYGTGWGAVYGLAGKWRVSARFAASRAWANSNGLAR